MNSALYHGRVEHARTQPRRHAFGYKVALLYLDLAELEQAFDGAWLWSLERPNVCSFRRRDYLGDPDVPLADAVRARATEVLGRTVSGPVRMLTCLRTLGYAFNPVTFYYCFSAADPLELDAVVAEITNTPWGERHSYVLAASGSAARATFSKAFHVSPFFDMDHEYRWRFSSPGAELRVHMQNRTAGVGVFDVDLRLEHRPLCPRELRRTLLAQPLITWKISAAIYWQALRLWLKRMPFFTHPRKRSPAPETPRS